MTPTPKTIQIYLPGGDPRGSYPTYFFGSMLNRGYSPFGGKPVCFTELGFLSPEGFSTPLPGSFAWAQNTSVAVRDGLDRTAPEA